LIERLGQRAQVQVVSFMMLIRRALKSSSNPVDRAQDEITPHPVLSVVCGKV
jgi:hypothetical protein